MFNVRAFTNDFRTTGYLMVCSEVKRVNNGRGTRPVETNVFKLVDSNGNFLVDKSWEIRAVNKIIAELADMGWQEARDDAGDGENQVSQAS